MPSFQETVRWKYQKAVRERRKAKGLCPKCGDQRDGETGMCSSCLAKQRAYKSAPERYSRYKEAERISHQNNPAWKKSGEARRRRVYDVVYAAYGDKCACCGEANKQFLSIDHINNDGYIKRAKSVYSGNPYQLHTAFKKTGKWPDDVQLLCFNCNLGKARNKGICPHKATNNGTER